MEKDDLKTWTEFTESKLNKYMDQIPDHMHEGLKDYVLRGIPPGGFLEAALANDFKGLVGRADAHNINCLQGWAMMIYNAVPSDAQGSYEKVEKWIKEHPTNDPPSAN